MDRSPEEIAQRLVETWLMRTVDPVTGTADEVGEYLSTVYTRVLQAVKSGQSQPPSHGMDPFTLSQGRSRGTELWVRPDELTPNE